MIVPSRRRHVEREDDFPADLISADEAVDLVVDAVAVGSKSVRRLTKKILKAQERLRRALHDDAWKAYLRLEELTNDRASKQMDLVVRWALAVGIRSRR